ncbi:MAG: hypothetical protein ABF780_06965 [Bifidobacterium aquikefiri]|uniref:Uncharacterized protein n=1 Tax=Bifidobacterium aquikefiri TaxID=1653207 RepID=A0A261G2G2_9BIFI|nr:hypothetical protein [Bifidobacterium aquikefiri]OZG65176.1 hypothetical protein BAQU_1916 [Bifidobacterium aquikefiri]
MKGFFHNISWAQIFAGALAAVTAFLLSAKIGIAGSVIGVAVGSIVSTVATQIYQRVLDESSKKIQKTVVSVHYNPNRSENNDGNDQTAGNDQPDLEETRVISSADETAQVNSLNPQQTQTMPRVEEKDVDSDATAPLASAAPQPRTISGKAHTAQTTSAASKSAGKQAISNSAHAKGADTSKISLFDRRKRKVLIVAIVSAILAFGGTAGIIYAVTNGQGTDQVVRNIVSPSKTAAPTPSQSNTNSSSPSASHSSGVTSEPEPSQSSQSSDAGDSGESTSSPSSSSSQSSGSTSSPSASSSSPSSSASSSSSSSVSPSASASTSTAQPEAGSTSSTD